MTQIPPKNKKDLSEINTLKDLRQEIVRVKTSVKLQEREIAARMQKFPEEATIVTIRSIIPLIAKKGVPENTFNLIRSGIGLIMSLRRQKRGIQAIISQAKEVVLFSAFNKLLRLYQQKRNRKKLAAVRE